MEQIVTHFTDTDLYCFNAFYYIIQQYPNAEVRYKFFDRNKHKYPVGFGELLQEQVNGMTNVIITDEEVEFMKKKCYYLPEWFFTLLKGFRFDPSEVKISQDEEGHLDIDIEGKWWRTILWEMPILSTVSELSHILNGDLEMINPEIEYQRAFDKAKMLLENGVQFSEMGTRRRLSKAHQANVVKAINDCSKIITDGKYVGTSNVYLSMLHNTTPIGTMMHALISFEECVSGVHECNFNVMKRWLSTFPNGSLGVYLFDCFGDKVFFDNCNGLYLKAFDGLRVDSGDNLDQLRKIVALYNKYRIDPRTKSVIFSNALDGKTAIEIHKEAKDYVKDSMGIGTWFVSTFDRTENAVALPIKPMNIVIKLVGMRYNAERKWLDCVKLSSDKGKVLGDPNKVKRIQDELGII